MKLMVGREDALFNFDSDFDLARRGIARALLNACLEDCSIMPMYATKISGLLGKQLREVGYIMLHSNWICCPFSVPNAMVVVPSVPPTPSRQRPANAPYTVQHPTRYHEGGAFLAGGPSNGCTGRSQRTHRQREKCRLKRGVPGESIMSMAPCVEVVHTWWQWHPPIGFCVAVLGVVGVLVPWLKGEGMGRRERAFWSAVMIGLTLVELWSIRRDQKERDAEQAFARCEEQHSFEGIVQGLTEGIQTRRTQILQTITHVDGVLEKNAASSGNGEN